jgi:hypothetical protein
MITVLENLLETTEQRLVKSNQIPSLYNVSIPTQVKIYDIQQLKRSFEIFEIY